MRDAPRRRRLGFGIAATAGFLLLSALRAVDLQQQRTRILETADQRASTLSLVLAEYVRQSFASVDASLRQLALHSRRVGGPTAAADEWLPALVAARAALRGVGSISVTDRAGIIRHSTQPAIVGESRAGQYVVRRLASDTADALVADETYRALRGIRPLLIPLGRRLTTSDGAFLGTIVATLFPADFRPVFEGVDVGAGGEVAIYHRDGTSMLRVPPAADSTQPALAPAGLVARLRDGPDSEMIRLRSSANAAGRRVTYRRLSEGDLAVVVTMSERDQLAGWRRDVILSVAALLGVGLLLLVTGVQLDRQARTRRAAQEALARSERLESVGRLTGGVAHDFNNLLTVILGNAALLKEDPDQPPSGAVLESANQIERAALRGASLVHQLLAFARQQPLHPRIVDVGILVAEARPMLDRVLGEDLTLHLAIAPESHRVNVDPVRAESALLNLCLNARDAMAGGGSITVRVRSIDADVHPVRATGDSGAATGDAIDSGKWVMLEVEDDGEGIAPAHLAQVFEPFFTTKAPGRGTGLGLSSVHGFVSQSGGRIRVRSAVGRGTTVSMYFPAAAGLAPDARDTSNAPAPRGAGEVILLAEDEPDVADLAEQFLRDQGYDVLRAPNGPAALAMAHAASRLDLLLTDVVMPGGMSGWELAAAVVRDRPGVRVLFMSGYADDLFEHGRSVDPAGMIAKPFDRGRLTGAVAHILTQPAPGRWHSS